MIEMDFLKRNLPLWNEIQIVFGLLVFAVFSWSIRGFLFKLSSFLLYYKLGDIFGIFAYMMAVALLESTVILLVLLLLAFLLPGKWFSDGFSYKASLLILVMGIAMIFLQSTLTFKLPSMRSLAALGGISIISWLVLIVLTVKVKRFKVILDSILERISIFLYIYPPLGCIGLIVVFVRNLL